MSIIVVERGEHLLMANKKSDVSTLLSALTTQSTHSQVVQNTLTTSRNICCDNFQAGSEGDPSSTVLVWAAPDRKQL